MPSEKMLIGGKVVAPNFLPVRTFLFKCFSAFAKSKSAKRYFAQKLKGNNLSLSAPNFQL
jgi:hypothetical protein